MSTAPNPATAHTQSQPTALPYQHIACCIDDSPVAVEAADEAARLRSFSAGRLTFLHAVEPSPVVGAFPPLHGVPMAAKDRERFTLWLEAIARSRSGRGELLDGYPPGVIVDWIANHEVDLVIAGSHRGAVQRLLLGGFASYLAAHSSCSVLVVRPDSTTTMSKGVPFRHIAVCVDDSEPSRRALEEARTLAEVGADKLSIVHVAQWPLNHVVMGYAEVPDPTDTFIRAERWLNDLVASAGEGNAVFLKGYPPAAVCEWAEKAAPDLIVAASHRGIIDRLLLGSFANYVAYHAPCEVLLTRVPTTD